MLHFIPRMIEVRQTYPPSEALDIPTHIEDQFEAKGIYSQIAPGMKVAVGVGSRGIGCLAEIVKAIIHVLSGKDAKPFIVPAMGSHGGGTPEGQLQILAHFGITEHSLGVPIEPDMEVRKVGTAFDELDVVFSSRALDADAVVVINRVKPHTDFQGSLGSGIQKMLAVGLGKQIGAAKVHQAAARMGHEAVIRKFAEVVLNNVEILCAVAILEDQHHRPNQVKVLRAEEIVSEEPRLFEQAKHLVPRLPMDEIDLLIVDQIGKDISGTGMDTNVIGRDIRGYSTSLQENSLLSPHVFRIFVRELSPATDGNGIGIGLADFTTARAVKSLDLPKMYLNALTSIGLQTAKIPIYFDCDRDAIHAALSTLASRNLDRIRIVRIVNTLCLERMMVSECCVDQLKGRPRVSTVGIPDEMQFDKSGNLIPF